ncbi:MAG: 23S rRNA (adenine(2503)-C(2))-methyltransferase RlmN [Parcubacteria group bacterium]
MDVEKIKIFLEKNNQPKFRLAQIQKAVFEDGVSSFEEITTLSKELRHRMSKLKILSFEVEKVLVAKDGQSVKALLKLEDGKNIETVLISPKPGVWSVCISCQVGCPMNCRFCATGRGGFARNLTAEEITDQILFWRQYLKKNSKIENCKPARPAGGLKIENYDINNIVYMGMGEPFLNWENVRESLKNLINKNLFGLGSRSISVSTAGIPEGIEKLAQEFPQVNLAISLHFADDKKRSVFMPVNKKYNLEELRNCVSNYLRTTNRKVFVEYILLENINDSREDAEKLAKYLKLIGKLQLLHVNLIRYNTTGGELKPSSRNRIEEFKNFLLKNHIQVTIRKSLGEEIQGACGQLVSR